MTRRPYAIVLLLLVTIGMQARERAVVQPKGRAPLDDFTLKNVQLESWPIEVAPGDQRTLRLVAWHCCWATDEVKADVRFSMDPNDFATIDADTGFLQILPTAPPRQSFRVYADIEHGRRILSADVWIDTPASNPLRGYWQQAGATCFEGHVIHQLVFRSDGTFSVTWDPFEVYTDYWGYYTFDRPAKGRLSMGIRGGNYVPPAFAGDGQYTITEKDGVRTLVLHGIDFGIRPGETPGPFACTGGATFESYH